MVIVDPEPLYAAGVATALSGLLGPDPVIYTAGAESGAIAWPGSDGLAIIGVRRHEAGDLATVEQAVTSGTATIVLGLPANEQSVANLVRWGVREVLPRNCGIAALIHAVQTSTRSTQPTRSSRATRPTRSANRAHADSTAPTPRELEVVFLLAQGLSNRQIAAELFISEHTVRNHLGRIYDKLDVGSRTQAVMRAGQLGWVLRPG